ncbi:MAG: 7-carboxy-7-deazaguanine synthase QueE [Magnetococcales bacterium]|nr:7-carboxy-7-deazaguanine synthase QueE [Magnetococcales bacterium]
MAMTTTSYRAELYPICDLVSTLQGEGTWAGMAVFLLRFSGCPLACSWCDEPRHRDPQATRHLTPAAIVAEMRRLDPHLTHILLTGGEPLAVPGLFYLVDYFKDHGYWQAMETSGVGGEIPFGLEWVTLSPKTPLPEALFNRADEVKYIIGANPSDRQTEEIQERARIHDNVWVQPCSEATVALPGQSPINPQALQHCLAHIKRSGGRIRLSLQTHKWIGLP